MYHLKLSKDSEKFLKKVDKVTQKRVKKALFEIMESPYSATNITKLTGQDSYRKKVGNIRIVYDVVNEELIVHVINIDYRGNVYKKLWCFPQ